MKNFDIKQFKHPGSRYRGLPFWAWNTDVTADKVTHQIDIFKKMGFGGFIIHARKGLRTEYMGETFMNMVRLAIERAKALDLRVWLYDEDGWPSGYAGGQVTAKKKYRQKTLLFTKERLDSKKKSEAIELGEPYLLACFAISLDGGYLKEYRQVAECDGCIRAYVMTAQDNPRFNGQAYIDVMNSAAVERFIELTHERYFELFGEDYGKTVEAVFTDEPQIARVEPLSISDIDNFSGVSIPWSDDFDITYKKTYGEDIVARLPEIIFELKDRPNTLRYRFNAHLSDRFRESFAKKISENCLRRGIKFTGHYLYEQSLETQALSLRDVMRNYAELDIPGIDVLLGGYEFTTALQCRSVANQYGREQMMSELYGVTNYTSDFRDYIHWGNWQAALGVTERVPHLTWMSMLGEGKRDYPANFGYQAPWHEKFASVEDHFARLNTVLKAGRPNVKIAMIHPIESHWLIYGPDDKTKALRLSRDEDFHRIAEWLIFDLLDFDYLNEALLPEQFDGERVGEMEYAAVVIPDCLTVRKTTLDILKRMKQNGTEIIFAGRIPELIDGEPSPLVLEFAKECSSVEMTEAALTAALDRYRGLKMQGPVSRHIACERTVGDARFVFISPAVAVDCKDCAENEEYLLTVRGEVTPSLLDTFSGEISTPEFRYFGGNTEIRFSLSPYDSLLLRLESYQSDPITIKNECFEVKEIGLSEPRVILCEQNTLLLDIAEFSLDGENYFAEEEILRIDKRSRGELGLPPIIGKISPQPWSVCDDIRRSVFLRFYINSEAELDAFLSFERAKAISLNGEVLDLTPTDHYIDVDFKKIPLPRLKKGKNLIEAEVEISKTVGLEPMYLLGNFGVELCGHKKTLKESPIRALGTAPELLLPFYGGNIDYEFDFYTDGGELTLSLDGYSGALLSVYLDGRECGDIILPPYELCLGCVEGGNHTIKIRCYGNRHNTFGSLHAANYDPYCGPLHWLKEGDDFTYDYQLCPLGLAKSPKLFIKK